MSGWVVLPPTAPGQRIGLYGGSFNPPHAGHVAVAQTALRRLRLDRLWWLVSPGNPLKDAAELASPDRRAAGIRAIIDDPRMVVSSLELAAGLRYSAETLAFIQDRAAGVRFVWIMGADNLAGFHRWGKWREIAASVPIAVFDRPGWRLPALASPAARWLAPYRLNEASASQIARREAPAWVFLSMKLHPDSSTSLRQIGLA